MRQNRILTLLGGAAVIAGVLALTPDAQAACYWGATGWTCEQSAPQQIAQAPLPSVPTGTNWGIQRYTPYGYNYSNYNQIPNDYPGPALTGGSGGGDSGGRQ
ncbi:MAG TPA: hypothetical protein VGG57_13890 [Stellaceae bacterium]|jgi:hypothetical protein